MKYTQEMNLVSKGYCMPFEQKNGDVTMTRGYGEQPDGSFHHGVNFETNRFILHAVADGVVSGIGSNPELGLFQVIRYGKYEVTYGHLANALVGFGTKVKAGSVVSISGDLLHMEVKYNGEELNPIDFLTMIYGNIKMTGESAELDTLDMDIPTDYDDDRAEIENLMLRFFPTYLSDVNSGQYRVPDRTEQSLRNIFSLSAIKNYFFELLPSYSNPMGLGQRAMPIAAKVQNLLIGDFLNYLALRQQIFLSTLSESDKKKDVTQQ
jgi:hypothetical protein